MHVPVNNMPLSGSVVDQDEGYPIVLPTPSYLTLRDKDSFPFRPLDRLADSRRFAAAFLTLLCCIIFLAIDFRPVLAQTVVYERLSIRGQAPASTVAPYGAFSSGVPGSPWNPIVIAPENAAIPGNHAPGGYSAPATSTAPATSPTPVFSTDEERIAARANAQPYRQILPQGSVYPAQSFYSRPSAHCEPGHVRPPLVVEPNPQSPGTYPSYDQWNRQRLQPHEWQIFPEGLLWPAYLAGVKESRFRGVWHKEDTLGWIWDITLGGRAGILRYGNRNAVLPTGIQLDIEGAAMTRLAMEKDRDLEATDYRFGLPLTFGNERWQFKLSYYHVSCHLGDEYMLRYLDAHGVLPRRINYYRDSLVFGLAFRPHRDIRLYGEFEYAVYSGEMTKRLLLQFGAEYAPLYPANRRHGAPFFAIHGLLMEELDFGGSICVQLGWMWRGRRNQALRCGLEYFYGADDQYEFFDDTNSKVGFGVWYDF